MQNITWVVRLNFFSIWFLLMFNYSKFVYIKMWLNSNIRLISSFFLLLLINCPPLSNILIKYSSQSILIPICAKINLQFLALCGPSKQYLATTHSHRWTTAPPPIHHRWHTLCSVYAPPAPHQYVGKHISHYTFHNIPPNSHPITAACLFIEPITHNRCIYWCFFFVSTCGVAWCG